jgi:medium-chain acyl-[acyl-carrier-protein] hydrolase
MHPTAPARDPWIVRPRPLPDAKLRLFLLPHAGAGASFFRGWADAFSPQLGVEVCAVQLPGRETRMREPPFDRWEPLVAALSEALVPHLDLPYAVFGHSTGAMVGFELARTYRRSGRPLPVHLFPSGRPAPHLPRMLFTYDLPDEGFIDSVRELGGIPEEVLAHRELMGLVLPILRADMAVNELYEYREEPPLDVPITVYGGLADPRAEVEHLEAWAQHTTAAFRTHIFPGDHFYLTTGRHQVLDTLARDLAETVRTLPG